jgi:hypothetical protein
MKWSETERGKAGVREEETELMRGVVQMLMV